MGHYLIRVEGRLSEELTATFPTMASSHREQTVLHGTLTDPGSLAEMLEHLRAIGVHVLDVHRVPGTATEPGPADPPAPESTPVPTAHVVTMPAI